MGWEAGPAPELSPPGVAVAQEQTGPDRIGREAPNRATLGRPCARCRQRGAPRTPTGDRCALPAATPHPGRGPLLTHPGRAGEAEPGDAKSVTGSPGSQVAGPQRRPSGSLRRACAPGFRSGAGALGTGVSRAGWHRRPP